MGRVARLELEPETNCYPLSSMQQGMLFHALRARTPGVDISQVVVDCPEALDAGALEQAWQHVARRHEILRTRFLFEGLDEPRQQVQQQLKVPFKEKDWRGLTASEQAARLEKLLQEKRRAGFEPAVAPLMRVVLVQRGTKDFQIVWTYHHILLDARSLPVVLKDLFVIYEALREEREPKLAPTQPYRSYIDWLQKQDWSEAEKFWREKLKDFTTPTPLMAACGGNGAEPEPGSVGEEEFELSGELAGSLRSLAKEHGLTLNTFLQGAWAILLARYTGEDEVVFGAVRACRRSSVEGAESMAGLFINTLPVRTRVSGSGVLPWLKQLRAEWIAARPFEHTPLVKVQSWSEAPAGTPLFESILNVQDPSWESELQALGGDWARRHIRSRHQPGYPLALDVYAGEKLSAKLVYDPRQLDATAAGRLLGHFRLILEQMARDPQQSVSSISLLDASERAQVLQEWNRTEANFSADKCVPELFEAQAARDPAALALSSGGRQLTYGELNERANRLAAQLQALGVKPEVAVGICADRSIEMVLGQLAILKAGGAYVPIDPAYPQERIRFILRDAGVCVLLTQKKFRECVPAMARQIFLEPFVNGPLEEPTRGSLTCELTQKNLAYIIYTSGSTGQPKGVEIEHAGLMNLIAWHQRTYKVAPSTRASQLAGPAFDAAVWEVWPYLAAGASVHIPDAETRLSPRDLLQWLATEKIDICFLPTPLAEAVLDEPWPEGMVLRALLTGGDRLHRGPAKALPCALVNHYGPTECTVVATAAVVEPGARKGPPPIGRPIANTSAYILDGELRPVPIGVPGELHLGGVGLARGYRNRPELTVEKSIRNPFGKPSERLYKTGDRARFLPDGNIEFLGRIDQQVKIRGYRIEPGEIENCLMQHAGVREAVVVAHEEAPGEIALAAYVVLSKPGPKLEELRDLLMRQLPEYMVPEVIMPMERLQLTPNGKVDRRGLPKPVRDSGAEKDFIAPRSPIEKKIAAVWAEVLRRPQVSLQDNFFRLGGHSLLAAQAVSRLRRDFSATIGVHDLFECPTVATLAERIERRMGASAHPSAPANSQVAPVTPAVSLNGGEEDTQPLTFAQERLWFLEQMEPGRSFHNVPAGMRLHGPLDTSALQRSLTEVVRRHEALRTVFAKAKGKPTARVAPPGEVLLPMVDLRHLPTGEREPEAQRLAEAEARMPFNLGEDLLLRAKLVRLQAEEHLLVLTTHHIVSDGWSMAVLYRELDALYDAFAYGLPSPLPPLPMQYGEFARWQRQMQDAETLNEHLSWWRGRLQDRPPALELPTDRPRPAVQTYRGATHFFSWSSSLHGALNKLCRSEDVTLFMLLLAGFQTLLHRYSGQEDLIVGAPISGRNRPETESLIGLFLNSLVLRSDLSGDPPFRQLLQRVRQTALEAYARQDLPFERLVEALAVERDLSRAPLFQIMFVLQPAPFASARLNGLKLSPVPLGNGGAKFDLTLFIEEGPEGLSGSIEYNTDLFDSTTIQRLPGHLETLLQAVVENPSQPLSTLPILSAPERRLVLEEWNKTATEFPREKSIHQLFQEQVRRTPDSVAIVFEDEQLTYRELDERSTELARRLQSMGVGPDSPVAICLPRSLEMMVGLLGILKSGACYMPLDPTYPRERLSFMLDDSQARVLLTSEELAQGFSASSAKVVLLNLQDLAASKESVASAPETAVKPENLAYVIYTSGSTGKPKGVMLSHRNVVNFFTAMDERVGAEPGVWLAVTSISFDISVLELFWTLTRGFKVVIQADEGSFRATSTRNGQSGSNDGASSKPRPAYTITQQLSRQGVTHLQCTPSLASMLIQDPAALKGLRSLRKLLLGGEALPPALVRQLELPRRILNMYGPTETTVWSASHAVAGSEETIPIGRPVANTEIYILDRNLQPVPAGVPGELLIGGAGVARGYLNRPELTAERFIPHPFSNRPGARLYRTGDLARFRTDGEIEFLGRLDHQVKLRGFRIELGEIEAALREHPRLGEAVVVVREFSPGDKRLVAYVTPGGEASKGSWPVSLAELRDHLKGRLPDYMLPSVFEFLDALPLTPNGKVDRKALPAPKAARSKEQSGFMPAQSSVEKKIAAIWQKLLRVEQIGLDDNFFDAGGHSLLVVEAQAQLSETFQTELSIVELFQHSTIRSLARFLDRSGTQNGFQKIRERALRQRGAFKGVRELSEVSV